MKFKIVTILALRFDLIKYPDGAYKLMTKLIPVTVSLPEDMISELDQRAAERDLSRAHFIRSLIMGYFAGISPVMSEMDDIKEKLDAALAYRKEFNEDLKALKKTIEHEADADTHRDDIKAILKAVLLEIIAEETIQAQCIEIEKIVRKVIKEEMAGR